jgi:tight adherence protein B
VLLDNIPLAIFGTLVAAMLPLLWWSICRFRRIRAMQKGLPETLELMADGIRAGQNLEMAAEMVSKEAPKPLAEEFGYCVAQLRLGHSPVAVLERMARRVPLPEFKIFTTAVLVHRQTGGNLALLAQRLAQSARDHSELMGHVKAVTAGSRLSMIGLTLGTLVAIGFLASVRPEYVLVFRDHELAPTLLATAAILQLAGILWVWRILKVSS